MPRKMMRQDGIILKRENLIPHWRWLSVDPKRQSFSPYVGMGNNPINLTDPNGKEVYPINTVLNNYGYVSKEQILFESTFFGRARTIAVTVVDIILGDWFELPVHLAEGTNDLANHLSHDLTTVNLDKLTTYNEVLYKIKGKIDAQIDNINSKIEELSDKNPKFNADQIRSLTKWRWDLKDPQLVGFEPNWIAVSL